VKKRTSDHALLSIAMTAVLCAAVESSSNAPRLAAYRLDLNDHGNPSGFNPAQHLLLEFTPQEVRLGPPGKILALRLTGYGYGSRLHPPAPANPTVAGNRAEYHRRELTEWYLNEPPAVTQGFTLSQRPGDAHPEEPLILAVTVADGAIPARPAITPQGDAVLLNPSGGSRLRYGELHSHDARGRELPSHLAVRGPQILLVVQDSGAEYPLVVEPTIASTLAEEAPPVDTAPGPYLASTYAGGLPSPTASPATSYYLGPTGDFSPPQVSAVATDPFGNTYLASTLQCVFRVDSNGNITRVAGTCKAGSSGDGGPALSAQLNYPEGVAADAAGNLYIADRNNNRIRKVSSTGTITTVAGTGSAGFSGDNGPATSAQLNYPSSVALDPFGNLYIADQNNNRIRMVSPTGAITTVAGNGSAGYTGDNVPATSSALNYPTGVAADSSGNLFIADTQNNRIREVSGATITTVAGNGNFTYTGNGGPATSAGLEKPQGVAVDSNGTLYIADTDNNWIRAVSGGTITAVAGTNAPGYSGDLGPATSARLWFPGGVATDPVGNVYIADSVNNVVRKFAPEGNISTIAGSPNAAFSGDGGPAILAPQINGPWGVAVDPSGNLYFADSSNDRIREISSSGTISTVLSGPPLPAPSLIRAVRPGWLWIPRATSI
jgi:sugar lactone lactonase YvrE